MSNISQDVVAAAGILRQGGLIGLPTETVYGLAADATNTNAIKNVFQAKNRPADHPVIIHIASLNDLDKWAVDVPEKALVLAQQFWPGPMTLILKRRPQVPDIITGGQDTVGIRFPAHPMAQAVIQALGQAIIAPSANRFGHISPTCAQDVIEELGNKVDLVLDGGACEVGIESTIIDCHSDGVRILRYGMLSEAQILQALTQPLTRSHQGAPRVSGALASHYAPVTPVRLVSADQLDEAIGHLQKNQRKFAVLAYQQENNYHCPYWFAMPAQPQDYARCLYRQLRAADHLRVDLILIEAVPSHTAWVAVQDRLNRASFAGENMGQKCWHDFK